MNEQELRLECLRLAVAAGRCDPLWMANEMFDFVCAAPASDEALAQLRASREAK